MKGRNWLIGVAGSLMLLCAGSGLAADTQPVVKATNKADFEAVATAVRQQIAPGGRWEFTNKMEKEDIDRRLDEMQSLFDKYSTTDQMNDVTKTELFNDQEAINGILTKRDDNRVVCSYEQPLGSLIPQKVCRSYGDMERQRQEAQQDLYQKQFVPQLKTGG